MHVPSTQDLLAQVPLDRVLDTAAWRQRAHSTKQARSLLLGFRVLGCRFTACPHGHGLPGAMIWSVGPVHAHL